MGENRRKGKKRRKKERTFQGIKWRKTKRELKRNVYNYRKHSDRVELIELWRVKTRKKRGLVKCTVSLRTQGWWQRRCFLCPIPSWQCQPRAAWLSVTWVEGSSFQPTFVLYCVVLTQVESYVHHVDTKLSLCPLIGFVGIKCQPSKIILYMCWGPSLLQSLDVDTREKVEQEKTWKGSPAASFFHPTREILERTHIQLGVDPPKWATVKDVMSLPQLTQISLVPSIVGKNIKATLTLHWRFFLYLNISSLYSHGWDLPRWTSPCSTMGLGALPCAPCCIVTLLTTPQSWQDVLTLSALIHLRSFSQTLYLLRRFLLLLLRVPRAAMLTSILVLTTSHGSTNTLARVDSLLSLED